MELYPEGSGWALGLGDGVFGEGESLWLSVKTVCSKVGERMVAWLRVSRECGPPGNGCPCWTGHGDGLTDKTEGCGGH